MRMESNAPAPAKITLNDIRAKQNELRKELADSQTRIGELWHDLVAPPPTDNKAEQWMSSLQRGFAIYDGVMTGYKLFRRFQAFLPKRKKK